MYGNPYMPMGFQQFQPNFTPQPQIQPQQQPQVPAFSVGQVATIEQVEQIQLQPNERKIILVQSQPVIAMRSADAMGLVSTRFYNLTEYNPNQQKNATQTEFAPMSDVQELKAKFSELAQQLSDMKGALNNGKPTVKRNSADS